MEGRNQGGKKGRKEGRKDAPGFPDLASTEYHHLGRKERRKEGRGGRKGIKQGRKGIKEGRASRKEGHQEGGRKDTKEGREGIKKERASRKEGRNITLRDRFSTEPESTIAWKNPCTLSTSQTRGLPGVVHTSRGGYTFQ
jgi:hypothetical protein